MRQQGNIIRWLVVVGLVAGLVFVLYRVGSPDVAEDVDATPETGNETTEEVDLVAKQNAVIAQLRREIETLKGEGAEASDTSETAEPDVGPTPAEQKTDEQRIAETIVFATDYWTYDGADDLLKPSVLDRLTDGFRERLEREQTPPSPSFQAEVKDVEVYLRPVDATHVTAFVEVKQSVDIAGKKSEDNVLARVHWTSTPDGWRVEDVTVPTIGVTVPAAPEGEGE